MGRSQKGRFFCIVGKHDTEKPSLLLTFATILEARYRKNRPYFYYIGSTIQKKLLLILASISVTGGFGDGNLGFFPVSVA